MGVLNVTPDSFTDGGRFLDPGRRDRARRSPWSTRAPTSSTSAASRPGQVPRPVDEAEEQAPRACRSCASSPPPACGSRSTPARPRSRAAAIDAGASIVNDVSARLHEVAAAGGAGWVAMHMQGEPQTMQDDPRYDDVVAEVRAFLVERAEAAAAAGVREIWIDPGIGFGKTADHNLALLGDLDALVATGWPVVVGTSRKAFIGRLHAESDGTVAPVADDDRSRARWRSPRGRRCAARRWCGCTTSRATVDALAAAWRRRHAAEGQVGAGDPARATSSWILKDQLGVCERPGGYGANHRRVRRQEEIIWIREQGFTCVISLIPSPHNLHNYDELGVAWQHRPFGAARRRRGASSRELFTELDDLLARGGKVLVHRDELGDRICGLMAGYLLYKELVPGGPAGDLDHRAAAASASSARSAASSSPPPASCRARRRRRDHLGPHRAARPAALGHLRRAPAGAGATPAARGRPRPRRRPARPPVASDDLADTVDYGAVCAAVEQVVTDRALRAARAARATRIAEVVLDRRRQRRVVAGR